MTDLTRDARGATRVRLDVHALRAATGPEAVDPVLAAIFAAVEPSRRAETAPVTADYNPLGQFSAAFGGGPRWSMHEARASDHQPAGPRRTLYVICSRRDG